MIYPVIDGDHFGGFAFCFWLKEYTLIVLVLEARSKCQQGWFPEGMRETMFHDSLLASGGLLEISGMPWFIEALLQLLHSSSHGVLACMSL